MSGSEASEASCHPDILSLIQNLLNEDQVSSSSSPSSSSISSNQPTVPRELRHHPIHNPSDNLRLLTSSPRMLEHLTFHGGDYSSLLNPAQAAILSSSSQQQLSGNSPLSAVQQLLETPSSNSLSSGQRFGTSPIDFNLNSVLASSLMGPHKRQSNQRESGGKV